MQVVARFSIRITTPREVKIVPTFRAVRLTAASLEAQEQSVAAIRASLRLLRQRWLRQSKCTGW